MCIRDRRNTGGLAMEIPFGTIYTTNITPDVETGIGSWSYAAFERAMRHGVDRQGRYLYPAFPYTAFTRTRDDDLQALYAYLMSQPPVKYRPPATDLHFPFNIRQGIFAWNLLFLTPGALPEQSAQSADWNRGAYLVEGLGPVSYTHLADVQPLQHLRAGGEFYPANLDALRLKGFFQRAAVFQQRKNIGFLVTDGDLLRFLLRAGRQAKQAQQQGGDQRRCEFSHPDFPIGEVNNSDTRWAQRHETAFKFSCGGIRAMIMSGAVACKAPAYAE